MFLRGRRGRVRGRALARVDVRMRGASVRARKPGFCTENADRGGAGIRARHVFLYEKGRFLYGGGGILYENCGCSYGEGGCSYERKGFLAEKAGFRTNIAGFVRGRQGFMRRLRVFA